MQDSSPTIDPDFAAWCRDADVAALGRFFDSAAPGLLRLATHLSGSVPTAEDLVQQAFLAAIEKRATIDPDRAGRAWLVSVMRRKAVDRARRLGRGPGTVEVSLDRLAVSADEVDAPLLRLELESSVQSAIAGLESPYREVVTLRLKHGATAPEIAEVTGASAGAVRVQLHRGLEKLRASLPASLAMVVLGSVLPAGIGLDAIRAHLVEQAVSSLGGASAAAGSGFKAGASTAAPATPLTSATALVMSTKFLLGGAAVIALALTLGLLRNKAAPVETLRTRLGPRPSALAAVALAEVETGVSELRSPAIGATQPGVELGTKDDGLSVLIQGLLLDAGTGEPVAGALISAFEPVARSAEAVLREDPDLFTQDTLGNLVSRTGDSWPIVEGANSGSAFLGESVIVGSYPAKDASPIAQATSNGKGEFEVGGAANGRCLLRIEASGFGTRFLSAGDGEGRADGPRVIRLHHMHTYGGTVVNAQGEPLQVAFAVTGISEETGHTFLSVQSDHEGRFEVTAAATTLRVRPLTHGYRLQVHQLAPGPDIRIWMYPQLQLRVLDDETGEPLGRVQLIGTSINYGGPRWTGSFQTQDGYVMPSERLGLNYLLKQAPFRIDVWADGFQASQVTLHGDLSDKPTVVRLLRGVAPETLGTVRRGSAPVENALVELLARSAHSWDTTIRTVIDAARSDKHGRFSVRGPDGPAVIRVTDGEQVWLQPIDLPLGGVFAGALDIDLSQVGRVDVRVVTTEGAPVEGHWVRLDDSAHFYRQGHTDAEGRISFTPLAPATYRALAPFVTTEHHLSADVTSVVELRRGSLTESVELVVPDPSVERHLWVELDGTEDFSGWSARTQLVDWTRLTRDGEVAIDLATGGFFMRFRAPNGRRWLIDLPTGAPHGTRVPLPWGPARIRGYVRDETGAPLAGCEVRATSIAESTVPQHKRPSLGCVTDADGSFSLSGLGEVKYLLRLVGQPDRAFDESRVAVRETIFRMTAPAGPDTRLALEIPSRKTDLGLYVTVLRADGTPWTNQSVFASSVVTAPGLEIDAQGSQVSRTAPDGTVAFVLARGDEVTVSCFDPNTHELVAQKTIAVTGTGDLAATELRLAP